MLRLIEQILNRLDPDWRSSAKWFFLSIATGIAAGLGAITFQFLSEHLFAFTMGTLAGYHPRAPGGDAMGGEMISGAGELVPWLILLLPTLGGLLSGWVVFSFAPEAEGHGTDAALASYHQKSGLVPWRVPVVKTIASVLTLGTGGSGGREGPIAQIGGGFGSFLATRLRLSVAERRVLLAAGMGAGVGSIFRAPLAGALFASEIHYSEPEFESEAIIPSALASIIAYCVFSFVYGWQPLFTTYGFVFRDAAELLPYAILAVAVSGGAYLFIKVFYGTRDLFVALRLPNKIKPAIGGALTGMLGLALYYLVGDLDVLSVLGFGYGALQGALDFEVTAGVLLLVALGKILTTGLTIGSGGSGGVFGPSMVIGGSIGGAVGIGLNTFFPNWVSHPEAYVLVGMAGFFAGAAKTPISTIIMVSEMTGNHNLLLPSLWVTTLCYLLLRRVGLYERQLKTKADSPAHRGDFHFDILDDMKVADVLERSRKLLVFHQNDPLGDILKRVSTTEQAYFPIVDQEERMVGIFSLNDIREFLYEDSVWKIAIAADFAQNEVAVVRLGDDLSAAIRRFTERNLDELPVVSEHDSRELIGLLRRKDVVDAYNRRLWSIRKGDAAPF